jgi:hypothetical protein
VITQDDGADAPGASNAEINRELAIIKRTYRLARQAGKLLHVPHIPMLAKNNVRQGFFERDAFEATRAALPEALRGVITFAYLTGWRVQSEILPLQWAQVDRAAQTLRLEPGQTKNAEGRTLPYGLLPELAELIDAQWQAGERLKQADMIKTAAGLSRVDQAPRFARRRRHRTPAASLRRARTALRTVRASLVHHRTTTGIPPRRIWTNFAISPMSLYSSACQPVRLEQPPVPPACSPRCASRS